MSRYSIRDNSHKADIKNLRSLNLKPSKVLTRPLESKRIAEICSHYFERNSCKSSAPVKSSVFPGCR